MEYITIPTVPNRWVAAGLLFLVFITIKTTYRLLFSPLAGFPGPKFAASTKLFEAYHMIIKDDWLATLEKLHRQYGPVVRIGPNELHFNDHDFCVTHHQRRDLSKCTNYYGLLNTLLGGISSSHGHAQRKSIIQPLFGGNTLAEFSRTTMDHHIDSLHDRLMSNQPGSPVNGTHYLWAYTNDLVVSYLVDKDMGYLWEKDLKKVHDSLRAFSSIEFATVLRAMPPVKKMFDIFPSLRKISPLNWLDELVFSHLQDIVGDDLENRHGKDHGSVLARLWNKIGDKRIVGQEAAQAMFIGNESLLSNLTCLLHYMIYNPDVVERLRAELDTLDLGTYGHRVWRDPNVLQLPYLDAVCRESTRLSSPSWHRQPRMAAEPIEYRGTVIPANVSMSFTLRLLERDPQMYPEPETFNPDRWLGQSPEAQRNKSRSVTFGTGSRTCLGQHIARHTLRKTLAALVYNFDISLWDQEKDEAEGFRYLNTYPRKGAEGFLNLHLTPRFVEARE